MIYWYHKEVIYMPAAIGSVFPKNNFIDLCIYQAGYQACDPLHGYGPALRNNFLFHYILSGRGELNSKNEAGQNQVYKLEKDQGFMIWPKQENTYCADKDDPWEYCWIEFGGIKAQESVLQAGLTFNHPEYKPENKQEAQKMKEAMLHIVHNRDASTLELIGHCHLFLSGLAQSSESRKETTAVSLWSYYTQEILNYIERNYHIDISVEDIAAHLNLNRSHVSKIFKSTIHTSLRDFLLRYRINKACELMETTHKTIGEISAMVGYSNTFNFSRAFKSVMGVPPSKWRVPGK